MLEGLLVALSPASLLFIAVGVVAGIVVGALPGFTATMGTALLLPFTFALPPEQGLAMLGALYVASQMADAIPACLVNTPGTPSAMTTAWDGFPLTKQGRGQAAIVASGFSALVGTAVGGFTFMFLSAPLADIALRFGPPEFFWIGVFALTLIGSIAGDSLVKGIAGGVLGLLVGTIGISATGAVTRYTFGITELRAGLNVVAALIGVFAVPQVLSMVAERRKHLTIATYERRPGITLATIKEVLGKPVNLVRSSAIGTLVGILPGAGGPVATLVSYNEAVRWSRDRRLFGKGALEGVVASEAAGNGAAGGAMVPLIALGIPGSAPAAVILGALLLQGIQPGPQFFISQPVVVYSFAWAIILAGAVTFLCGAFLAGTLARVVLIPVRFLAPSVMFLSIVGAFAIRNNMVDVFLMLGLGVFVYVLWKAGFHPGPIGLGIILGPIVEPALVQALAMAEALSLPRVFLGSAVSKALIALTVVSVAWILWTNQRERRHVADGSEKPDGSSTDDVGDGAHDPEGTSDVIQPGAAQESHTTSRVPLELVSGLVLLAIVAVFVLNAGEGALDWVFPLSLGYTLAIIGVYLAIRGLLGFGDKTDTLLPVLRGRGVDVSVFAVLTAIYVGLWSAVGFWITSGLMLFAGSVYLDSVRSTRRVALAAVVAVAVCVAAYLLLVQVLYVPLPRARWLPF